MVCYGKFSVLSSLGVFILGWCWHVQGFLQSNEVHIFGYARTKISDDELRNRIRG